MCDELVLRPRALHAYELSNKQLRQLEFVDKRHIACAWRTAEGYVVYMVGDKPNAWLWKRRAWVPLEEEQHE